MLRWWVQGFMQPTRTDKHSVEVYANHRSYMHQVIWLYSCIIDLPVDQWALQLSLEVIVLRVMTFYSYMKHMYIQSVYISVLYNAKYIALYTVLYKFILKRVKEYVFYANHASSWLWSGWSEIFSSPECFWHWLLTWYPWDMYPWGALFHIQVQLQLV